MFSPSLLGLGWANVSSFSVLIVISHLVYLLFHLKHRPLVCTIPTSSVVVVPKPQISFPTPITYVPKLQTVLWSKPTFPHVPHIILGSLSSIGLVGISWISSWIPMTHFLCFPCHNSCTSCAHLHIPQFYPSLTALATFGVSTI